MRLMSRSSSVPRGLFFLTLLMGVLFLPRKAFGQG